MPALPYWFWPGDDRPPQEIDDEVREELRLHLDLLAEQAERRGATPDDAKRQAAERFGDYEEITRRCRIERQGDIPMLKRVQTVLFVLILAAVILVGWQQRRATADAVESSTLLTQLLVQTQSDVAMLRGELALAKQNGPVGEPVARRRAARADLAGAVTGPDGKPIAGAKVLLIVKTWPNNRFRQDDYAVETDDSGEFVLKNRIPLDGQYGVNAAVVADGYAIESTYVLVKDPAGESPEPMAFELSPASPTRLVIADGEGDPLPNALVAPASRTDTDNEDHLVYFQGSKPSWQKTDEDGVVVVTWFQTDDIATVRIRARGGEWRDSRFTAPRSGETLALYDRPIDQPAP